MTLCSVLRNLFSYKTGNDKPEFEITPIFNFIYILLYKDNIKFITQYVVTLCSHESLQLSWSLYNQLKYHKLSGTDV